MSTTDRGDLLRGKSVDGGAPAGKVRVCLRNATKKTKGMHYKNTKKPRFVAKKGKRVCTTRRAKGTQTWRFWKSKAFGIKKQVGMRRLDLNGFDGRTVWITWARD